MKAVNPYLNFAGNTEEAFEFYRSVFGGDFLGVLRFRDFPEDPMNVVDEWGEKIAHVALPIGAGVHLMGTDAVGSRADALKVGNNFSINLEVDSAEEGQRLFDGLSAGGSFDMPLADSAWAEKYGMCTDKYGVQWMVNFTGNVHFQAGQGG